VVNSATRLDAAGRIGARSLKWSTLPPAAGPPTAPDLPVGSSDGYPDSDLLAYDRQLRPA
jgi:hypothetical protein